MTDKQKLCELFEIAKKLPNFSPFNHNSLTDKVNFYVDSGDYATKSSPEEIFFAFTAFGFEVRNTSGREMMVDGKMNNFSEFDFNTWYLKVKEELEVEKDTIVLNGKKYRRVDE